MRRTCTEPVLKAGVLKKFRDLVDSGRYGYRKQLTMGSIMRICKENKLCRFKENWKSLLNTLREDRSPAYDYYRPWPALLEFCGVMFKRFSRRFDELDKGKVALYLKGSKGMPRHHMLHLNHVHRKILELEDCYDFHREFPLLRTPAKIHALDDVVKLVCEATGMPFRRTAVIQPPKCKARNKKRCS